MADGAQAPLPTRAEDLTFEKCLGRGYFGEVWRAQERAAGPAGQPARTFAVKKVKLALITENKLTSQLQREIKILYSLKHPRIVQLHFDFNDGKAMYLGMEFAQGGSLFERLRDAGRFPPEKACKYFLETCQALDYIHHLPEKVIHRDIKPENILLDGEDHVKLADFGWANHMQAEKRDTFCGTLDYLPPEMIMGTGHDESADMWNMGVLLYELCTGQSPFGSSSKETTCKLILSVDLRFPPALDVDAKDLVRSLCRKKPAERLPVRGAMEHRFVVKFFPREPEAPAPTAPETGTQAAGEATAATDWGRPSVAARRLRDERAKISAEMDALMRAKQNSEDDLARHKEDLAAQLRAIESERKRRRDVEATFGMLEKQIEALAAEAEDLKRKCGAPPADAKSDKRGLGWFRSRTARSSLELAASP